jgi:predicted AlkP superfamily phosphohydrolase/phosphomutase/tetratricopeptide (TPR) repeat protein
MQKRRAKKLLIVGWDAADWKIINPLLDSGQMPALERLVNRGVMGNIVTLDPPLSPMLWTSIATGKTADKHGILNFAEPHPEKLEIRPVSSISRKTKAFWNILNQNGMKCNVIGWWPSNPAEPINGAMISNLYPKITGNLNEEWPLYPGSVHPPELSDLMKEMRIHGSHLSLNHLVPFIPNTAELFDKEDKLVKALAKQIAEAASIHNAATWLMENTEWDVTAVYYDAIDVTCHNFMKFHPPQMPGIPDEYFNNYKDVVNSMYKFHDMMLERLLELAGEDTTVILLSDHGFHSDHLRPKRLPKEPDAPALEHRNFGVLCMSGPGIRKDERVYGASLLDITPTILTLMGLPIGRDMDGKPLLSIFENPVNPEVIESWDDVPGDAGMHPAEIMEDPMAAHEALQQLVELGYMEAPGPDMQQNIDRLIGQTHFNLARVYMHHNHYDKALPLLEKLYSENPDVPRYGFRYATCLQNLKRMDECRKVIDSLRDTDSRDMPQLDFMEGTLLLSENKLRQALECFARAEKVAPHLASLHVQVGGVYNRLYRWNDAIAAFDKALNVDPENAQALMGKGVALLRAQRYEEAAENLLDSVGLVYQKPHAHYFLGEALYHMGNYERGAEAFKVCISIQPGYRRAYAWLIKIYQEHLHDAALVAKYTEFMEKNIQGSITVVSGLPRSGTSMMMQMLQAGGLEILTDNLRKDDANNPKGYLEYEKVKSLAKDHSWMGEAAGKAVKIVTQLLPFIPPRYTYKVIYIQREISEVLRSQQVMLGKPVDQVNIALIDAFKKQVEKCQVWLRSQPHIEVMYVNYADVIANPRETAENVAAFLGQELDLSAMSAVVDPALYRNKLKAEKTQ